MKQGVYRPFWFVLTVGSKKLEHGELCWCSFFLCFGVSGFCCRYYFAPAVLVWFEPELLPKSAERERERERESKRQRERERKRKGRARDKDKHEHYICICIYHTEMCIYVYVCMKQHSLFFRKRGSYVLHALVLGGT